MTEDSARSHKTLYNDPTLSDITICQVWESGRREYVAHKAVLCNHSGWFMRALTGKFLESSESSIEVHDDHPDTFEAMMLFFYHPEFHTQSGLFAKTSARKTVAEKLVDIIDCHVPAEKYDAGPFAAALLEQFKQISTPYHPRLTKDEVEMLVHTHYPFCTASACRMSEALVTYLFKDNPRILGEEYVRDLVLEYGNFDAGLLIFGMRTQKPVASDLKDPFKW